MRGLWASTIVFTAAMAAQSWAADRPVPRPVVVPVVAKPFTWTGHYAGLHCGVAWGRTVSADNDDSVTVEPLGGLCGGQIGTNWQHDNVVFGLEADLGHFFLKGTEIVDAGGDDNEQFVAKVKYGPYATLTGRIGFAQGQSLLYLKGGAAFARITNTWIEYEFGPPPSEFAETTANRWGWALGGGWEQAINATWSWKLEYLAMDFGRTITTSDGERLTHTNTVQTFKLGVNHRF